MWLLTTGINRWSQWRAPVSSLWGSRARKEEFTSVPQRKSSCRETPNTNSSGGAVYWKPENRITTPQSEITMEYFLWHASKVLFFLHFLGHYTLFRRPTLGLGLYPSARTRVVVPSQLSIIGNKATKMGGRTGLHLSRVQVQSALRYSFTTSPSPSLKGRSGRSTFENRKNPFCLQSHGTVLEMIRHSRMLGWPGKGRLFHRPHSAINVHPKALALASFISHIQR